MPATAEPAPDAFDVIGESSCPAPEAVKSAIVQLTTARSRAAVPAGSHISVSDDGASFRVRVTSEGTQADRSYSDPARECERRARFSAVFAILTLMPPDIEGEVRETSERAATNAATGTDGARRSPSSVPSSDAANLTPTETSAPRKIASQTPPRLRIELAAQAFEGINASLQRQVSGFDFELRSVALRFPLPLLPTFSVAYSPNATLRLGPTSADLQKLQAALGARVVAHAGSFDFGGELALALLIERIRGRDLAHPASATGTDVGLRVRGLLATSASRFGPILALDALLVPAPLGIEILPESSAGHTPLLWLGASLGIYLGL